LDKHKEELPMAVMDICTG